MLTRKPRVGERLTYMGRPYGVVKAIDGSLCWTLEDGRDQAQPFIWRFVEGFNVHFGHEDGPPYSKVAAQAEIERQSRARLAGCVMPEVG